ncbi:hypothetical protein P4O66_002597 [Electrophorus voltai]|uniref:Uncharacterized protein n=1 Tax=Electrophorus voltai TaxID=2609070 RepID=A0AAD8YWS3_9TELE|nr:hypothetical protein P4O66_002597 [Electrophorus voltai]
MWPTHQEYCKGLPKAQEVDCLWGAPRAVVKRRTIRGSSTFRARADMHPCMSSGAKNTPPVPVLLAHRHVVWNLPDCPERGMDSAFHPPTKRSPILVVPRPPCKWDAAAELKEIEWFINKLEDTRMEKMVRRAVRQASSRGSEVEPSLEERPCSSVFRATVRSSGNYASGHLASWLDGSRHYKAAMFGTKRCGSSDIGQVAETEPTGSADSSSSAPPEAMHSGSVPVLALLLIMEQPLTHNDTGTFLKCQWRMMLWSMTTYSHADNFNTAFQQVLMDIPKDSGAASNFYIENLGHDRHLPGFVHQYILGNPPYWWEHSAEAYLPSLDYQDQYDYQYPGSDYTGSYVPAMDYREGYDEYGKVEEYDDISLKSDMESNCSRDPLMEVIGALHEDPSSGLEEELADSESDEPPVTKRTTQSKPLLSLKVTPSPLKRHFLSVDTPSPKAHSLRAHVSTHAPPRGKKEASAEPSPETGNSSGALPASSAPKPETPTGTWTKQGARAGKTGTEETEADMEQ